MTFSMVLVLVSVFFIALWFKRTETIKESDTQVKLAILNKTSWKESLKFASMMTFLISLQWMFLKLFLLS